MQKMKNVVAALVRLLRTREHRQWCAALALALGVGLSNRWIKSLTDRLHAGRYRRWGAGLVIALSVSAPGISHAWTCTIENEGRVNTGPAANTVVMPANLTIKSSDPAGTVIWRSPRYTTPYRCAVPITDQITMYGGIDNAISDAAVTVWVEVAWFNTAASLGNRTAANFPNN